MTSDFASRKANFSQFLEERMPVLVQFATALGAQEPYCILDEPHLFLPGISEWLSHHEIAPEESTWLLTRLGYLVGELLVMKYSGAWLFNEMEGSRYYGRYVVGQFAALDNGAVQVDPFEVAAKAISDKTVSLGDLFSEVCSALEAG